MKLKLSACNSEVNEFYNWLKSSFLRTSVLPAIILTLAVLAVYLQTSCFDFLDLDDHAYVWNNPLVNSGLSWDSFWGIWTSFTVGNWQPLTILSHQLDVTVFGLKAGGHHLTNVLLHAINSLLLFMVMRSFTGTLWRSFLVSLLFAIHPLHVESVAWVSERKDMLSAMFGFLVLLAYRRYIVKPKPERMALVTMLFALSLMSKPMLVTLPFLMLLLDWWPLCRFKSQGMSLVQHENNREKWKTGILAFCRLAFEKWPLFLLSAGSCVITMVAQRAGGAVSTLDRWPLGIRLSNAVTAMFEYLCKMLWPTNLGVFYPLPPYGHPAVLVAFSTAVVITLSITALLLTRRRPWWFTGWFWYFGTLVPVLGLVQVGSQSWADRYTYWPLIGIFIILSWECEVFWNFISSPKTRALYIMLVLGMMSVLGFTAWRQASYWKNTELLFKHTVQAIPKSWKAHSILGTALMREGRLNEALDHYNAAYLAGPRDGTACNNMGIIQGLIGNTELSLKWYFRAIEVEPKSPTGYYCAANAMVKLGRTTEAEAAYLKAISLDPAFSDALFNYANLLRDCNRTKEAEARYRDLLRSKPDHSAARLNLAALLAGGGNHAAAICEYERILELNPDNRMALNNMGTSLLQLGRPGEAAQVLAKAKRIQPDNADTIFIFALALAGSGRRDEALAELNSVLKINPSHSAALKLKNDLISFR